MPQDDVPAGANPGKALEVIKTLVANGQYHYSGKVQRYIEDGYYCAQDLERCVLTARDIHKVEADELEMATDGCKYTILGRDTEGYPFYSCGKIILGHDDRGDTRLYFFITAHEAR